MSDNKPQIFHFAACLILVNDLSLFDKTIQFLRNIFVKKLMQI